MLLAFGKKRVFQLLSCRNRLADNPVVILELFTVSGTAAMLEQKIFVNLRSVSTSFVSSIM